MGMAWAGLGLGETFSSMRPIDNPILKPRIELPVRKKWSQWMMRAPLDEN